MLAPTPSGGIGNMFSRGTKTLSLRAFALGTAAAAALLAAGTASAQSGPGVADPPTLKQRGRDPGPPVRPGQQGNPPRPQHRICRRRHLQPDDRRGRQGQAARLYAGRPAAAGALRFADDRRPSRRHRPDQAQQQAAGGVDAPTMPAARSAGAQPHPALLQRHQPPFPRPQREPVGQRRQRASVDQSRRQVRI